MARNKQEYKTCQAISSYLKHQYPNVIFHFDMAGSNLSKAQAGMMKGIQGIRGFPDLQILEARGNYHGLFLEVKHSGVKVFKEDGSMYADKHREEQANTHVKLNLKGYLTKFAVGFDDAKEKIDKYLSL